MGPLLPATAAVERIDLSSSDEAALAELVRQACVDVGFFYVVNPGVDQELVLELFEQSREFFTLPLEDKMKSLYNSNYRGYTPYLDQKLDKNQVKGDLKEGYYMGVEIPEEDVRARIPLNGPNVWPSSDLLPEWRPTMEKYREQMIKLTKRLLRLIALALRLDADYFDKPTKVDNPVCLLRLLRYTAEKSAPDEGLFGAGAHSDWGVLTILATDKVPGLQICKDKDARPQVWTDVPPIEGGFIVNLGDALERWTNNIFRSTLHRVVNAGFVRYSVAFFVIPNYNCVVKCLPTCQSKDNPPKYPPVISVEYIMGKYKETHAGYT